MGISSAGVGSGLDVNTLISQMMVLERQPLNSLNSKKQIFNDQLSAFGKVKSDLDAFKTAVSALKLDMDFAAAKATTSDSSYLTATATSSASPGSYDIKISQLAQAGARASASKTDSKAAIGTSGNYNFSAGGKNFSIAVNSGDSLEAIRDKINSAVVSGDSSAQNLAKATIINAGTSGSPQYKLVLTSTQKGQDNAVVADAAFEAALGGFTETQTAKNAKFSINGLEVERATNTVTDVVEGVTINLANSDANKTINLTVARDTEAITKKVNDFISAYNKLASTVNSLHQKGGSLEADNSATSVVYQLQNVFNDAAKISGNSFNYLAEVGISFKKDGTLSLDSSAFNKALETKSADVVSLFTNTERGFAQRLYSQASNMLQNDGIVDARIKGLNASVKTLDTGIDRENLRLTNMETRLRRQYANLDSLMGSLKNTSNYLTSTLR